MSPVGKKRVSSVRGMCVGVEMRDVTDWIVVWSLCQGFACHVIDPGYSWSVVTRVVDPPRR
jgi:hypothetical protein